MTQEADKMDKLAKSLIDIINKRQPNHVPLYLRSDIAAVVEALLEADKNGYERGRKEHFQCQRWMQVAEHQAKQDEALLREAFTRLEDFHPPTDDTDEKRCGTCEFLGKLKARLAPSDSGGEKEKSE